MTESYYLDCGCLVDDYGLITPCHAHDEMRIEGDSARELEVDE